MAKKKLTGFARKMPLGLARLKKLADHLDHGNLGHARFDMATWHEGQKTKKHCGSAGCALGECPVVFPSKWKFDYETVEVIGGDGWKDPYDHSRDFFDLTLDESLTLFGGSTRKRFNGEIFGHDATRHQVAANIYAFIDMKMKEAQ